MRPVLAMILEGVILYVFVSNFVVSLIAMSYAGLPMFSLGAFGMSFVFSFIISALLSIFLVVSGKNISKTGYIPFPFVVIDLDDDYYSSETQEDRAKLKSLLDLEADEIMKKIEDETKKAP